MYRVSDDDDDILVKYNLNIILSFLALTKSLITSSSSQSEDKENEKYCTCSIDKLMRLQRGISGINRGLHKSKTGHRRATKTSFHDGDDSSGDDDGGGDDNNVDDDDVSGYNEYEYDEYEYEYDDDDDDSHNHYPLQASSTIYPPT
jgi:hypothetical protein